MPISFEIIIPTLGGRERYLADALRSCLAQDYKAVSILVSNNGASSEVRDLVASFSDKRIRYVETAHTLPMPVHWDFALRHSEADVVSIIGDDDSLMPHAIQAAAAAFAREPQLECITHRPGQYYWPDYPVKEYQNRFSVSRGAGKLAIHRTKPLLDNVARFTEWYGRLPFLYHGFVRKSAVERIRNAQGGRIFLRVAPDVYSDLALAASLDTFGIIDDCLTIGGQGASSTGVNYAMNSEIGRRFMVDMPEDLIPKISHHSIGLHLYEYLEKIREIYSLRRSRSIAWRRFFGLIAREAVQKPAHRKEILDDLVKLCGIEYSAPIALLSKVVAAILDADWVATGLAGALKSREQAVMRQWRNAATALDVHSVWALAQRLGPGKAA
ncbi:MAG: glycosyltransferase family 2 protein [Gammaproteobacteria bacterium]|nr:glycosyltransferase family 2 protein [Gammaproteobacteria bacterium]